jgi:hypothetical protein
VKARFHPFSDLLLERYLAGELDADARRRIDEAALARPELAEHLRERRAEREAFKLKARALQLPAAAAPRRGWAWAFAAVAMAAALLLVVLVPAGPSRVALRGAAPLSVQVAVLRGSDVFEYREGVLLLPKDRIRLTVRSPAPGVLTVVAADARRAPTLLYEGIRVGEGSVTLPDSLELDDAPGPEELYLYLTPERPAAAELLQRVRRGDTRGATVLKLAKGNAP